MKEFNLDEIVETLQEKYPDKDVYGAICSALEMLTGDITEITENYLEMGM